MSGQGITMSIRHRCNKNTQFLKTHFLCLIAYVKNAIARDNSMPNLAEIFRSLHRQEDILILPNAWDAGSARLIKDAGAKAIATSSAGVVGALGYPDGAVRAPRRLAALTARITPGI